MDDIYRSQFRLPYPLYEKLKDSAETYHRSLNAEIVARLEESIAADNAELDATTSDLIRLQATLTLVMLDGLDLSKLTSIQQIAAKGLEPVARSILELGSTEEPEPTDIEPRTGK